MIKILEEITKMGYNVVFRTCPNCGRMAAIVYTKEEDGSILGQEVCIQEHEMNEDEIITIMMEAMEELNNGE